MAIVDKNGKVYRVDEDGNVVAGGEIDPSGGVDNGNLSGVSNNGTLKSLTAKDIQITFKEVIGELGFDEIPTGANAKIPNLNQRRIYHHP